MNFAVGDAEQHPLALTLAVRSSHPVLIPSEKLVLGGSGGTRTLLAAASEGKAGTATITVTAGDGATTAERSFQVTATNMPPHNLGEVIDAIKRATAAALPRPSVGTAWTCHRGGMR